MPEVLDHPPINERQLPPEAAIHTPETRALPEVAIPQSEYTPFYTLDEDTIRAEVAAALSEAPMKAPVFHLIEERHLQKGRIDNIHKAEAVAYAENPYRVAAKAIIQDQAAVPDSTFGDLYNLTPLRAKARLLNPFRWTRLTAKSAKIGFQWAINDMKRQNAAQIVGEQYDKMVAAALPYVPKLFHPEEAAAAPKPSESLTGTEETKPHSVATEQLVERLKLDTQLAEQAQVWSQAGIVEELKGGTLGIRGADSHEYPVPNPTQLRDIVEQHRGLVEYKALQGFTRLVLVPTAIPTEAIEESMKRQVATHFQAGNLHDNDGKPVLLSDQNAAHPEQWQDFVGTTTINGEALPIRDLESEADPVDSPTPGWKVMLVKNMPEIPQHKKELVFLGDRPEFLPGAKPAAYLERLQHDARFRGEVGLNLDMWYAYAMTELEREGTLIDHYGKTLLLGSYTPSPFLRRTKHAPSITWDTGKNSQHTRRLIIESQGLRSQMNSIIMAGVRTAVELS